MFDVAVRKGIKRGFLPAIDIHAILLVLGICVSYFGANQIAVLGNTLLIFGIISLVMTVFVWALLTLLMFNNKIGFSKLRWFFKNKKESMVSVVETKNYETTFQGKFETKKFTVFG
jgi:hypothetical protein